MAISASLRTIYASAPTTQRYIETLQFTHSKFTPKYITNDNQAWSFLNDSGQQLGFLPVAFSATLPKQDGQGNQDLALIISNIGRDMVDPLEAAIAARSEPIKCVYRVYLDTPLSKPQSSLELSITDIQVSKESVNAVATRMDVLNRAFPYIFYTYSQFPGLRR